MAKRVSRLFKQFKPEEYNLNLVIDDKHQTFSGTVNIIGVKVGRPSKRITLHQNNLKIVDVSLMRISKNGQEVLDVSRINIHKAYDEVRIHSDKILYSGNYIIKIKFNGQITKQMNGLYPCYFKYDGVQKHLLATQFESHHAREVFPCIDEPEAKATFDLSLLTEPNLTVLSNTPVLNHKIIKGNSLTTFETTPVMSTYLLAFIIGDMHSIKAETKNGTIIRSWATVSQSIDQLKYANQVAIKVLEFYEDYFQTAFPLKKCDQVALPDFESGAMENWGLITYREIALLCDPVNRSLSSEQYVAMVIAHELAHQWFGNLVTMKWWDDLWLNESFASLMEHIALDALYPDWNQWEQYTISDTVYASSRDVYKDVQAVRTDVNDPKLISTLFDPAIVYAKGGRLLKMLREYIGESAFREGLKNYFINHAYKNTTRDDLWHEWHLTSHHNIKALMDPWLNQSGIPVLNVESKENNIILSQQRLLLDGQDEISTWPIPLLANDKLETEILSKKTLTMNFSNNKVILNQFGSGHYIVNYLDEDKLEYLAQAIADQSIDSTTRINILNDFIILSRAGKKSVVEALTIAMKCNSEPREAVWNMMARILGTVSSLIDGNESSETAMKKIKINLAINKKSSLGWQELKNESENETLLRNIILGLMLSGEDKQTINEAIEMYKNAKKIDDLPSEQRSIILTAVVRHYEKNETEKLLNLYKTSINPDVQISICGALAETRQKDRIEYIIEKAIGKNGFVRPQDIFRWFAYLMRSKYSRELAWNWLIENWERLEKELGGAKMFDDIPVYAAGPLNTVQWQKKYTDFFTNLLSNPILERNIKISFSEIQSKVDWRNIEEPKLNEFLSNLS